MKRFLRVPVLLLLFTALLLTSDPPARANDIPTKSQVVLIFVAVGVVGAAIGVGVYYAVRQPRSITGCAVSGPTGFTLQNERDHQTLLLLGDTAVIKPGDRIQLKGKKKKDASGSPTFLVDKLTKDFGACKALPTTP